MRFDIITIGESLVELSTEEKLKDAECLHKYFGGDAIACAVSAKRLGSDVGFITKIGNDAFKEFLLNAWKNEGLDISQVSECDERNGLYLIARPTYNEKEFAYYRKKTAPSKLSVDDIDTDYLKCAKIIYSSGVTQSLSVSAREAVKKAFVTAKDLQIVTSYDPNFIPALSSLEDAKECLNEVIPFVDILFLSARHDLQLAEIESVDAAIKYFWDKGVSTVVIKSGMEKGYYTGYNGTITFTDFYTNDVCDTTCSGDAFNGGFLHGITHGCTPLEASNLASVVAGLQAKGIGAIKSIPYHDEVYNIFKGV